MIVPLSKGHAGDHGFYIQIQFYNKEIEWLQNNCRSSTDVQQIALGVKNTLCSILILPDLQIIIHELKSLMFEIIFVKDYLVVRRPVLLNLDLSTICSQFVFFDHDRDHDNGDERGRNYNYDYNYNFAR